MQNTSPNTPTLAETAQAMKQWRAQKKHNNEKMPDKLRSQIIDMLTKYQQSTVAQALRLSNSTIFALRQRQNNNSPKAAATQPRQQADVDFITFQLPDITQQSSLSDIQAQNTPAPPSCKIIHPNGAKLIINSNDITGIIKAFLCCR